MDLLSFVPLPRRGLILLAPLFGLACADAPYTRTLGPTAEDDATTPSGFLDAAARYDVPVEVLVAVASTESGMQLVPVEEEFEGGPVRWGLMGIPDTWIDDAAALAGVDVEAAKTLRAENIAAAAALLSSWATGVDREDPGAWAPVVARYGELDTEDAQAHYVHDEVYRRMADGVVLEDFVVDPWTGTPRFPTPLRHGTGAAERAYAVWRPSPNASARPAGASGDPSMVIIHSCEGAYTGCWSWLRNPSSRASAHYVVNDDGSEISQLVSEDRKAWHVGARYDCDLNGGVQCARDGRSVNDFSIGIEHAGRANQSSWNVGLLDASAQLVCDITRDHGIPRDAYHIVSHGTVQPYNRIDPGPNWPWARYLEDIRARCGDDRAAQAPSEPDSPDDDTPSSTPPASGDTIVIDSNNSLNPAGRAALEVSGNWRSSANVGGYYNTGYFWRSTGNTADGAWFRFRLDTPGCYAVDAWWAAGTDRSPTAPWFVFDADGSEVGYVEVDQRRNGGRWNHLGTYAFSAGWSAVALSRWAPSGNVVIADAVRVRPSSDCTASQAAGSPAPPIEYVIDSDNDENDGPYEVGFSSAWNASDATPGFVGTDYLWREVGAGSDPASFWFWLDEATTMRVDARWTAGSNRSASAPFIAFDANDTRLGTVTVDQRTNHATWVDIGTYDFTPGWNRIVLSHWTTSGEVVVADAVRVREVR